MGRLFPVGTIRAEASRSVIVTDDRLLRLRSLPKGDS